MQRQRGQSAVEFALIAPIIFMMIFGMIYGGFMFMEYMHYSNQVRTVARQIAVTDKSERTKDEFITRYKNELTKIYTEYHMPKMYAPTVKIGSAITWEDKKDEEGNVVKDGDNVVKEKKVSGFTNDSTEVVVEVSFSMNENVYNSLPNILKLLEFPPRTIKTLQYHMKLEDKSTT